MPSPLEERAASLAKRSLKKESKVWGLKLAISMIDLTTLEGKDTRGKVVALCKKAIRPDPSDPDRSARRGRVRLSDAGAVREAGA